MKISQIYNATAKTVFNICIFFLLINIFLFVVFAIKDSFFQIKKSNPIAKKYNDPSLKKVYPQLNVEAINDLIIETWSRPYIYEPFTLFKERPYKGHYVNVSKNGFRITKNQGPWPPVLNNINIFLFGGSTTFGYGVPDDQTIASYLQEFLSNRLRREVRVYNFGRGSYYSTQERILFERLLVSGIIPDLAVFIDGFNDIYLLNDKPAFSDYFEQVSFAKKKEKTTVSLVLKLMDKLPITRLAKLYLYNLGIFKKTETKDQIDQNNLEFDEQKYIDQSKITDVINRYLENKKIIEALADVYAVKAVFVWHPIPSYKYDVSYHLFFKFGLIDDYLRVGYFFMERLVRNTFLGENFLWTADIQENLERPLYVDKVHYSAEMSEILAVHIGKLLLERNFLMEN